MRSSVHEEDAIHSNDLEIDNLPNRLTLFRMLLIPVIVGCLYLELLKVPLPGFIQRNTGWIAAFTFGLAAFTDFVDGYIARKRQLITVFGSFLDPIADKFLVVSSLVMLMALDRLSALVVMVLILREFYITSLRLLATNEGLNVPVNNLGKWKTTGQMIGIVLIMVNDTPFDLPLLLLGKICIYASTILSLYSATTYSMNLVSKLKESRRNKNLKAKQKGKDHGDS